MGVSFPFSLVFSRLFVQLFVKVSQTIVLPLAFLNLWDGFGHCSLGEQRLDSWRVHTRSHIHGDLAQHSTSMGTWGTFA